MTCITISEAKGKAQRMSPQKCPVCAVHSSLVYKYICCIQFVFSFPFQNLVVPDGVTNPCILIEASEKGVGIDRDEPGYAALASGDSLVRPSPLPHLG